MTTSSFIDLPFELTGPLPSDVTVLEASAGTGKTYTIAALAARFIAEGRRLPELLLVTFTRMATGELRERVRERLVSTEAALTRFLEGGGLADVDEVVALLADGPPEQVRVRRDRLAAAVSNFDAATIATTHGFCQEVLAELGTLGDLEPDVNFAEEVDDLIEEVIDDLYVRRFYRSGDAPFNRAQAGEIARMAIENPTAVLHPRDAPAQSDAAMRVRLAEAARKELERRKRRLAVMTYDDLLTRLLGALRSTGGAAAADRLRDRYRVVLIDEFQDTDPVQWEIVQRAFGGGGVTLVLIADPKQAIYAFRGADVYAYLQAARSASSRATLRVNRRSDQPLLDAFDVLFGDAKLGHPEIAYRQVRASDAHQKPRLIGAPSAAALRVRVLSRDQPGVELTAAGYAQTGSARECVAKDLAADIVSLLQSGAEIERRAPDGSVIDCCPVSPGDVAVLVQSHRNAALVAEELGLASVPAVINGAGSVFATTAALDWLRLLQALERPAYSARARSAALTPLLGWTAARVRRRGRAGARGAPSAAALLGAGAARARDGRTRGHDLRARAGAGAGTRAGRRRARADRPPAHRAAAARRRVVGAARHGGARVVAAPADRRRRDRGRTRGSDPPARVRRRCGTGADDPPLEGTRVPDRLRAVPVGAGLDPGGRAAGVLPRRGGRRRAGDRCRSRGPVVPRARRLPTATRSAARTCG